MRKKLIAFILATALALPLIAQGAAFKTNQIIDPVGAGVVFSNGVGTSTLYTVATSSLGLITTNVAEGTNLYWTNSRFDTRFALKTTDDLTQGSTNKYYATSLFNTDFATKSTSNLTEGSNLYFTNARAISALTGQNLSIFAGFGTQFYNFFHATTTDALSEGSSNLYFTNARVNSYISASTTIPKTYSANTWTGLNTFTGGVTIGSLNGPLQANNGVVSATTSIGIRYGGTGTTSPPTYGQMLIGNSAGGYDYVASSTLGGGGGGMAIGGSITSATAGSILFAGPSGVLAQDNSNLFFNSTNRRLGIQVASPLASLHVDAIYGDSVDAPASLGAVLTLDTAIDRPTSVSATQIDAPTNPSIGVSLTQIDYVNGGSTSQNTGASGYTANCQQIDYRIYGFRNVNGVRVVNPNYYSTSFTDTICDFSTPFGVDISSIATSLGNVDGYIIERQEAGGGFNNAVDIGLTSSYTDSAFSNTDIFEVSAYAESGASWYGFVGQYVNINGTSYRSSYATNSTADSNQGQYLALTISGWSLTNDGFIVQHHNGYYFDIGGNTTYYDWGQTAGSLGGDYGTFSSIAFPGFNTSITASSGLTPDAIAYGGGSFTADGSTWTIEIWDYRTNPVDGLKYYVGSPAGTSYGGDDSSFNPMTFNGNFTPSDGTGAVVKLLQNGTVVAATDVGAGTSWSFSSPSSDITTSLSIGSYTGITRDFSTYGFVTSPSTKYSVLHRDNSFTDTNPADGYLVQLTISGAGSATGEKTLQTINGSNTHVTAVTGTGTFYLVSGGTDGDLTITPSTSGFLANGSNLSKTYHAFSTKSISGTTVYSATYASATTTDPNDGLYYNVDLTIGSVSGATYRINKVGVGWEDSASTSFTDSTVKTWAGSSTITPTQSLGNTAIFDRANASDTSLSNVLIRNTTNNAFSTFLEFQGLQGGSSYTSLGKIGFKSSGNLAIVSNGAVGSGAIDFGPLTTPYVRFGGGSGTAGNIFNVQASASRDTTFLAGTSGTLAIFDTALNTVLFGKTYGSWNYDPTAAVGIQPKDTGDVGLVIYPAPGAGNTQPVFLVKNSSATQLAGIDTIGSGWFGTSASSDARLTLGSPNSSLANLRFTSGANMPSTPVTGGVSMSTFEAPYATDGALYFTNNSSVTRRIQTALSTGESARFIYVDGFGNMTTLNNPIQFASGIITFSSAQTVLFQNGYSVGSGKDVVMGSGARFIGGLRMLYASRSTTGSLNVTNNSPFTTFTGSTASQTLTLPTAASISGTVFEIANVATVSVTVNTTSSQTINLGTGTVTSLVLQPGDRIKFIANASSGWEATWVQNITTVARGGTGVSSFAQGWLSSDGTSLTASTSPTVNYITATSTTATSTLQNTQVNQLKVGTLSGFVKAVSGYLTTALVNLTSDVTGTLPVANGGTGQTTPVVVSGAFSQVGTATTVFTVTIGATQANTNYEVNVTPTSILSAAYFYVNNKTTTTFDVVYLAGLTGTVTFDWALFN
jgi:hypothetical protein